MLRLSLSLSVVVVMSGPSLADKITLAPLDAVEWKTTPEGVSFADLEGDRLAGTYLAMVRLPAGTKSPLHVKSANMFGLMISGEMVHYVEGAAEKDRAVLKAGGYYKIPAGLPHVSACVSKDECVTFLYQDGAFDFIPVLQ